MCFGPCYHVDGGLTSLSTSKDGSQVVVAGRNGETMSTDHFVNYIGTITLPPPHFTSAPYIPTMWPYYYHGYFDLSSYSATKLSVMGPSWPSWPFGLHENNNTFQESWLWANQQFIKNDQWLPAQNLDIDSKCFSKTKCFTRQCFLFETYKTQETYLFDTSCHFVIYQQFRCYHCSALQNRQPWVKNVTN